MDLRDRLFVRKLAIVLVIKLVALAGLWWGFVRDQRVIVDTGSAAARMLHADPVSIPTNPSTQD